MTNTITPATAVKKDIANMKNQFKAALPNHISVDKFVRTIQTAVGTSPELVQSTRPSLFAACLKAASDGLLPDGREAAIVTFKSGGDRIAQYMPMVGGILKKVRNSGELATITAQVVHQEDQFEYWIDEKGEHLNHRPKLFGDRGPAIATYAQALTKDGAVYIEIMTEEQIKDVEKVSRGKNGPWSGPFRDEMKKKSVIRRLSKRLPMSTDLEHTIRADDELYDLDEVEDSPVEQEKEVQTKPNKLNEIMNQQTPEPQEASEEKLVEAKVVDKEPVTEEQVPI